MESIVKDLQVNLKRNREDEIENHRGSQGSNEEWNRGRRSQRRSHDLIRAWEEEERRVRSIQEKSERRRLERQRNVENAGEKTGVEEKEKEEFRHEEEATDGHGIDANKKKRCHGGGDSRGRRSESEGSHTTMNAQSGRNR